MPSTFLLPLGNSPCHPPPRRRSSLGSLSILPDNLIVTILDTLISTSTTRCAAVSLANFSAVSSYTFAFATDHDLWRALTFRQFSPQRIADAYSQSWRCTFLTLFADVTPRFVPVEPVYSDVLFHKSFCLTASVQEKWLLHSDVQRIDANSVSKQQFQRLYERPNVPVIITGALSEWPAYKTWSINHLKQAHGETLFHAGGFNFPLSSYFTYCQAIENRDDQPLYIFDKHFSQKAPALAAQYSVPSYFSDDFFKLLNDNRPDYRWLIIGPSRSGSSFHKDPNCTSAWNAVISGRKKWLLYPPDVIPPGIYPSVDEADVTAPVSVSEWFHNFYDRDHIVRSKAVECVVEAGELIFVPMGWWHCVINLDTCIAITQNYVGQSNLEHVINWLSKRPKQISGCATTEQAAFISQNFAKLVREYDPELLPNADDHVQKDQLQNGSQKRTVGLWQSLTTDPVKKPRSEPSCKQLNNTNALPSSTFSFGF